LGEKRGLIPLKVRWRKENGVGARKPEGCQGCNPGGKGCDWKAGELAGVKGPQKKQEVREGGSKMSITDGKTASREQKQ